MHSEFESIEFESCQPTELWALRLSLYFSAVTHLSVLKSAVVAELGFMIFKTFIFDQKYHK